MIIYILKLKQDKYYVGKTGNLEKRLKYHKKGRGSSWSKKYKMVELAETFESHDSFDEDKWVLKYMSKYGIENVRGGSFCRVELSAPEKHVLQKMISSSMDRCYICHQDHFVKECPYNNRGSYYDTIKFKILQVIDRYILTPLLY